MRTVRFGVIGCGMMGREFASAAARWLHLPEMTVRPEIVAVCNRTLETPKVDWFRQHVPTLRQVTSDYRELLKNPEVEAVYIAVPHNLHEEFYIAAIEAGKHLMGEKPFGIDLRPTTRSWPRSAGTPSASCAAHRSSFSSRRSSGSAG